MPYRKNGNTAVKWPRAIEELSEDAREHWPMLLACCVLSLVALASVLFTAGLMWYGQQERQIRQHWIETKFEQHVNVNTNLLHRANQVLEQQAATNEHVADSLAEVKVALEATQQETREFRRAVLEWLKAEKIIQ